MNWAFVDYENVGSLEALSLTGSERLFVFCGPKNTRLKFGQLPTDSFRSIELIGVATTGPNNLDFHLAFHLGRFHEIVDKDVAFHIISNDASFNGLINHLKKIGRSCRRVEARVTKALPNGSSVPQPPGEQALLAVLRLKQLDGRKRPRKKAGLINWIKS